MTTGGHERDDSDHEVTTPVVGTRARFGVIVPATNAVVEHDYHLMAPEGVTCHTGRMFLPNPVMDSDEGFIALLDQIRASIGVAVRDVLCCQPNRLVMGMSAETFWGGVAGNAEFTGRVSELGNGLAVSTGATACREALETMGARRLAVFSPYQPVADRQVAAYFTEAGFEVVRVTGLRCPTATSIAAVPPDQLIELVRSLDGDDVDAIVQVGTNLSFVRTADAMERVLGKPVLAINAATFWHALRGAGIDDRVAGVGRILRDH